MQLAHTEPTSSFGNIFQYSNTMASAAGYIAGHLEYPNLPIGAAYDKAMQTLIFNPLGMSRTTFDMQKALAEDHASPHGQNIDGVTKVVSTPINDIAIPYRPAGEAWSSPHDMIGTRKTRLRKACWRTANASCLRKTCCSVACIPCRLARMNGTAWG